ncbi:MULTISPECIES: hypothetical protein [Cyanophyceae]|uniref:hypothetical protein n=1 Tax=Cyanophyceae TaxID=3028117 RepID=UPI001687C050|nr:hypothetical protein [Trichocoleus sp. FACHB-69]
MNSESTLIKQIESQLVDLGYNTLSIVKNFKTPLGSEIDLLILDNNKPRAVIELKSGQSFPQSLDPTELRFHPAIRMAQRFAKEASVPYYAVASSERILWFETDRDGRPRLLTRPVFPTQEYSEIERASPETTRESISHILFRLIDLARQINDPYKLTLYTSIAIYARILSEMGDSSLERALSNPSTHSDVLQSFKDEIQLMESLDEGSEFFFQALDILSQITFLEVSPSYLLAAFDEFLLIRNQLYAFQKC